MESMNYTGFSPLVGAVGGGLVAAVVIKEGTISRPLSNCFSLVLEHVDVF